MTPNPPCIFRREVVLIDEISFQADALTRVSHTIMTDQDEYFVLLVDVEKTGSPPALSYIWVKPQFVDDDGTPYRMIDDKLGDVLIEYSAVPAHLAVRGLCIGKDLRVEVVSTGALTSSVYYTVSVRVQFFGRSP